MDTAHFWLERLRRATEYGELREIFAGIQQSTEAPGCGVDLANAIDEAIRRLHVERLRDEQELQLVEEQYRHFLDQKSGLIGWIKRSLPFSQTRRQERGLKAEISDQKAEILAYNLMIARAQIVKEHLLDGDSRRMGSRPDGWSQRFAECRSLTDLPALAIGMDKLAEEQKQGQNFIEQLAADIEAFDRAEFNDATHRQHKQQDLADARRELEQLRLEIEAKRLVRQQAVQRAATMVRDDLADNHNQYRRAIDAAERHAAAQRLTRPFVEELATLYKQLDDWVAAMEEARAIPDKQRQLSRQIEQAHGEHQRLKQAWERESREFQPLDQRYREAVRAAENAAHAAQAAKKLYDSYVAEHKMAEADPHLPPSGVEVQYRQLQQAQLAAEAQAGRIRGEFQRGKGELDRLQQRAADTGKQIEEWENRIRQLESRAQSLRRDEADISARAVESWGRMQSATSQFERRLKERGIETGLADLDHFASLELERAPAASWRGGRMEIGFDAPGRMDPASAREVIRTLRDQVANELNRWQREQDSRIEECRALWTERCRELLEGELLDEVLAASVTWVAEDR